MQQQPDEDGRRIVIIGSRTTTGNWLLLRYVVYIHQIIIPYFSFFARKCRAQYLIFLCVGPNVLVGAIGQSFVSIRQTLLYCVG